MHRRERHAHRADHVARIERAGRAGGTGRNADAEVGEVIGDRFALYILEADVQRVRQTMCAVTVDADVRTAREDSRLELVAEGGELHRLVRHPEPREFAGLGKTDDVGNVLRARTAGALLMSAQHERLQLGALADVEDADALRRVELVSAHRQHVDGNLLHVHRNLARDLHGVRMENRPVRPADLRHLLNRKENARLVVGPHDRNQRGWFRG